MKNSNNIVIDRPLEKVFLWMFQPQHIVQLVTRDHTQNALNERPIPASIIERYAQRQRFWKSTATEIEIEDLSTPMLQVGTTFQFNRGVRGEYVEGVKDEHEGYYLWDSPMIGGTIAIKEAIPSTLFAFATTGGIIPKADYRLSFQAQQGKTAITYKVSMLFGTIQYKLFATTSVALIPIGDEEVRQQIQYLKMQMEAEID